MCEAYTLLDPDGFDTLMRAIELAKKHKTKVAITLASISVIKKFRLIINELLEKSDLVFLDFDQAKTLTVPDRSSEDVSDREVLDRMEYLRDRSHFDFIITAGSEPITFSDGWQHEQFEVPAVSEIKDPTGAGDAFAGAVLAALVKGFNMREAIAAGCNEAGKIIQVIGARDEDPALREALMAIR